MFKHILIPTDGSELSQKAIRIGVELAKFHGARVTGVHAIPDYHLMIAYEGAFDPVTEERIEKEARMRAENYLDFIKTSAAPIVQILQHLERPKREAAWTEIEEKLKPFETGAGWEGPNELLLTAAQR